MKSLATLLALLLALTTTTFAQNGVWVNYNRTNSNIASDTVMSIVVGANHTLWLGTWKGLDEFDGTTWTSFYNNLTDVPSRSVNDLNYSFDALWIAHGTGVTKFDGSTWQTFTKDNSGLVSAPVLDLVNDYERVWAGTARGLGAIDDEGVWTQYTTANTPAIPYNGINGIADDHDNLWLSFIGTSGLVKFPNGNSAQAKRYRTDTIPNMPQGYISSLAVDWAGNVWAGMELAGAVRINAAGATQYSTQTTSAFSNNKTHKIAVDHCGKVWVATEGGVAMYDGSTWTAVRKSGGGLANDWVYTVYVDPDGHVWFGTQGGVSEFKPLPEKPVLTAPANWATVTTDSVTCRWTFTCPNILKYWHELADNPEYTNSIVDTTSTTLMQTASKWDTILKDQTTYYWRVRAMNDAGWGPFSETWTFSVNKTSGLTDKSPYTFALDPIVPNPSRGTSSIGFTIPYRLPVVIRVFDVLGKEIATVYKATLDAGHYTIPFKSSTIPSAGNYIYRLEAGSYSASQSVEIVR